MTAAAAPLQLRPPPATPASLLLEALTRWAGCPPDDDTEAVLQLSDGEVTVDFSLTAAQATALAAAIGLLRGQRGGRRRAPR
jgi:hypothetical protein